MGIKALHDERAADTRMRTFSVPTTGKKPNVVFETVVGLAAIAIGFAYIAAMFYPLVKAFIG